MLGYYNYTVILTYLGLLAGFSGVLAALNGQLKNALICLMIFGFCDMFDGKIASTMERTKEERRFGIQIDSLCDLVCFGVLPAIIVYRKCGNIRLVAFASAFYLLCTLIRLAWFNVDEEERQSREVGSREEYLGLPVTSAALILPCLMGIGHRQHWPLSMIGTLALFIMGTAFLTPFRVKKPASPGKVGMMLLGGIGMLLVMMSGMDV